MAKQSTDWTSAKMREFLRKKRTEKASKEPFVFEMSKYDPELSGLVLTFKPEAELPDILAAMEEAQALKEQAEADGESVSVIFANVLLIACATLKDPKGISRVDLYDWLVTYSDFFNDFAEAAVKMVPSKPTSDDDAKNASTPPEKKSNWLASLSRDER